MSSLSRVVAYLRRNAIACLALFVALGGTGYAAAKLPANSVGTQQIRKAAVTPAKLARGTIGLFRGQSGPMGPKGDPGGAGKDGAPGKDGAAGSDGKDGSSVTSSSLSSGDAHCPAGGSGFTSVSGQTYACNGQKGDTGNTGPPGTAGTVSATVAGQVQANTTTFTALAGGPQVSVTVPSSGKVLVTLTAAVTPTSGNTAFMSFSVNSFAATDTTALGADTNFSQSSATYFLTGLAPGPTTITAKYRVTGGGNALYANRTITAMPMP